jgi:putative endonuclease
MAYFVYVLKSESSGKSYVGQTQNLEKRLWAHNNGLSPYTKGRGTWELVYHEEFETRVEAMKREKFLKTGKGREFLMGIGICWYNLSGLLDGTEEFI